MRFGFRHNDEGSLPGKSLDGSFRRSRTGISPDRRTCVSTASKSASHSKRAFKGLKEYSKTLVDIEFFSNILEDWVLKRASAYSTDKGLHFDSPFLIDDLRKLDHALEGVLFQQLFRMPYLHYDSDSCREEQFLALEDFLMSIINGLWRTFWHKTGPLPFFVSCPRYPGSRLYTVEKAISTKRTRELCGAAVVAKVGTDLQVQWGHILEFALFKQGNAHGNNAGFSAVTLCEALFYGFHILISRNLSKLDMIGNNSVHLLIVDSKFGGVVRFGGDLSKLEINSFDPYHSVAEWIKHHAEVDVSPVDRIWNKLGNANWGDVGTLQILLATFNSIIQMKGPPRKSIASLVADHSLRVQKRRTEWNGLVPVRNINNSNHGEIVEAGCDTNQSLNKHDTLVKLKPGDVVLLEDSQGQKGFQIKEIFIGNQISYRAVALDLPSRLLNVHVGVHPSRLELSWEAMSLWYHVQRQTKVLNIMKQQGISCKYIPELVTSGQLLHPGPCTRSSQGELCDHPGCGTPILVTSPVGETVSSIIVRDGPISMEEALRCCRDVLTALRTTAYANIQHGDICPENIVRVSSSSARTGVLYVPVSWGRAVLEDRDSPAMNLQFSSIHALHHRRLCPSSDAESLIYLLYFVCGGTMQQQDSIESALQWRERCWTKRVIQQQLGEASPLLKAFADYVDSLCGTPYPVDYDIWLKRLNRAIGDSDRGKSTERVEASLRSNDVAESSGTTDCDVSFSWCDSRATYMDTFIQDCRNMVLDKDA